MMNADGELVTFVSYQRAYFICFSKDHPAYGNIHGRWVMRILRKNGEEMDVSENELFTE
jgi:hypothetical protein